MPIALHGNRTPNSHSLAPIEGEGQGEGAPNNLKLKTQNSSFPSLPAQARNVVSAAGRALGAAISGRPILVPPEIRSTREEICASCEENLSGRCRKCGCGVRTQLLRKTHLATEQCPMDPPKWLKWHPASSV